MEHNAFKAVPVARFRYHCDTQALCPGAIGDVPDVTLVEVTGVAWAFVTWLTTTRYVCPLG